MAVSQDEVQSPGTKSSRKASNGKHTTHSHLLLRRQLQRPRQRQRKHQNDCISDGTNDRIGCDDGRLVEAFTLISSPVSRDWPADANLQNERGEVVDDQKRAQNVNALHSPFIWCKDSCDERKDTELDEQSH